MEGIARRVLPFVLPSNLVGVATRLQCLLGMQNLGMKFEDEPWPQPCRVLKKLIWNS